MLPCAKVALSLRNESAEGCLLIKSVVPQIPFVWPESRSGIGRYEKALPFGVAARTALSMFGVVSATDASARFHGVSREAMTNRFSRQGIRTEKDVLIKAMNVAGDHLLEEYGGRKAKRRAEMALDLIKQLEDASGNALAKCRALKALITTSNEEAVVALIEPEPLPQAAGTAGSR